MLDALCECDDIALNALSVLVCLVLVSRFCLKLVVYPWRNFLRVNSITAELGP